MKLKIYILDDEQHAIDGLTAMLNKKFSEKTVIVGSNNKALLALDEIESLKPDVLFLDVEMPELNGLELLKHFPERSFQIVFTTAYEQYALPALKNEATDYLLKPIAPSEMNEAIKKCLANKIEDQNLAQTKEKLTLTTAQELMVVNLDDIIRIEADNNYSCFYFTHRQKLLISKTLKEFEYLEQKGFYRVHQSHIINLNHVIAVKSTEGDKVLLTHDHLVEISRRKKQDFLEIIKSI